jgi:hypothetical protein
LYLPQNISLIVKSRKLQSPLPMQSVLHNYY